MFLSQEYLVLPPVKKNQNLQNKNQQMDILLCVTDI
jgi:hypothetical protein